MRDTRPKEHDYDDFDEEDDAITDCPHCGKTYDDADADFLICHHCGYNVDKGKVDLRKVDRSMKGFGIDPDVTLEL